MNAEKTPEPPAVSETPAAPAAAPANQAPDLPEPKKSLRHLAERLASILDDTTLSPVAWLLAGPCYQMCLHLFRIARAMRTLSKVVQDLHRTVEALQKARDADLAQITENFQNLTQVLLKLTGAEAPEGAPEGEPPEPAEGRDPAPAAAAPVPLAMGEAPAEPAPVLDRTARRAAAERLAAEQAAGHRGAGKKAPPPNGSQGAS